MEIIDGEDSKKRRRIQIKSHYLIIRKASTAHKSKEMLKTSWISHPLSYFAKKRRRKCKWIFLLMMMSLILLHTIGLQFNWSWTHHESEEDLFVKEECKVNIMLCVDHEYTTLDKVEHTRYGNFSILQSIKCQ